MLRPHLVGPSMSVLPALALKGLEEMRSRDEEGRARGPKYRVLHCIQV